MHLHGFDFFKEIDGKIHYMEDTHKANHHAAEEVSKKCWDMVGWNTLGGMQCGEEGCSDVKWGGWGEVVGWADGVGWVMGCGAMGWEREGWRWGWE